MSKIATLSQYSNLNEYVKDCAKKERRNSDYFRHLVGNALGVSDDRHIRRILSIPIDKIPLKNRALYWVIKTWEISNTENSLFNFLSKLDA
jgi:hypothetical protein